MMSFLTAVAVFYAALVGGLFVLQRQLIYLPMAEAPSRQQAGLQDMREVVLATSDGLALNAWYRAGNGRPTIVYFHGNAGHIGHRGGKVRPFLDAGWGMMLVEYRGYGGNPGSPAEEGLYADGRAALAFLEKEGVDPGALVLYGESLGSGVAVRLAAERGPVRPVGALVLEAPFTSIPDVAATHYPFVPARWLVRDRFDSEAMIAEVRAPLLVVQGERDRVVPIRLGRRLFEAARDPKEARWIADADHNDLFDHGVAALVIEFLERRLGRLDSATQAH